jgi:hypothetical protein
MSGFNRRAFLGMSVGAVSALHNPATAAAQMTCVSAGLSSFVPVRLTVDCASRVNFQLFRKNAEYLGLAGVVSMSLVRGRWGTYEAGNMFLFPWLKSKGRGQGRMWGAAFPASSTQSMSADPIPNATLPTDEYFCNFILKAPATMFIGFQVDVPYSPLEARFAWFSNVDKLADQQGVGIDWTSSNLNHPWFGGSRFIPNKDQCYGNAWRKLIVDALNEATVGRC